MTDKELKFECARMAIQATGNGIIPEDITILDFAKQIYEFISGETEE